MKKIFTLIAGVICAMGVNAQDVNYTYDVLAGTTAIDSALVAQVAEAAKAAAGTDTYSATINIPAGKYDVYGLEKADGKTGLKLPDGFSVNFVGKDGEKPVLNLVKSLDIAGNHDFVRFENVELADGGCQYVVNQAATVTNTKEIAIKNVTMTNMSRSFVRLQNTSAAHVIEKIIVDNCVVTNQGEGGYAFLHAKDAGHTVSEITVTNSTFNGLKHSFLYNTVSPMTITISDCTFYDVIGSGRYFVDANGQATAVTIKNTVLGKTNTESSKGIRTDSSIETVIENVYQAADCVWSSNKFAGDIAGDASDAIFTDPTNGDFTLKINDNIGDPRWYAGSTPDAISSIAAENAVANAPAFNLAGQKVGNEYKGIVVKNGKKIVRK